MHARVVDDQIFEVGTPTYFPIFHGARWWDCRDPATRNAYIVDANWLEVVETPKPEDDAVNTYDYTVELVAGVPTEVWTQRPWTQEELDAHAEQAAADAKAAADRAILDATAALMVEAHEDGVAWVQPTGAHDAYALGITVLHNAKTWENLTPANVWEPGVSGWREVVAEGFPAWVQPTGAHDDYDLGAIVSHNGQNWISISADNVWEPGVFGWDVHV